MATKHNSVLFKQGNENFHSKCLDSNWTAFVVTMYTANWILSMFLGETAGARDSATSSPAIVLSMSNELGVVTTGEWFIFRKREILIFLCFSRSKIGILKPCRRQYFSDKPIKFNVWKKLFLPCFKIGLMRNRIFFAIFRDHQKFSRDFFVIIAGFTSYSESPPVTSTMGSFSTRQTLVKKKKKNTFAHLQHQCLHFKIFLEIHCRFRWAFTVSENHDIIFRFCDF